MPHLLVDIPIDSERLAELIRQSPVPVVVASGELGSRRALPESELTDAIALLCNQPPINYECMTQLKLVQLASAGFKQIEGLGLSKRQGVAVCTASGVNDVPIAEWVVMMMIALNRDLPGLMRNQAQGSWDRDARFQTELRGKTIGIWGYGGIGREVARLASGLGLDVWALTRTGTIDQRPRFAVKGTGDPDGGLPSRVFASSDAQAFCASLDFLVLAIPATPTNIGVINRRIFDALPDHAFILNPARGNLIDEADLLEALRSGHIAGAALDTHFYYPMPADHPLWSMPNVIMTPHISGSTMSPHFAARLWELFMTNLKRVEREDEPFGELTPQQLDP